ncbi:MAG: homoserine O-acetyltransferase, partial [Candidatus Gastranaerophilales bacterium]|nr:homoserine O-acetyltransferase [Candidatus Gastranaerophilales bacterium]
HSSEDKKPGWWDALIGSGKAFDTDKFFVICTNILGGCSGTTGPSSINPETGKPYGIDFPVFTIEDTVKIQKKLLDYLGVNSVYCTAGGSMGGMQAMQFVISYPEYVKSCILIATTSRLSPQAIAFNAVGRNSIISDPAWNHGNYYECGKKPDRGLSNARMIGHITYLCEEAMYNKFGRKLQNKNHYDFNFDIDFQVESYLQHQGQIFVDRFDANSYLYITKAVDYFDPAEKYGSLSNAFKDTIAKFLIISFDSDWLFPSYQSKEIVKTLMNLDKDVSYCEIKSPCGHDAFLLEYEVQSKIIKSFLTTHIQGDLNE